MSPHRIHLTPDTFMAGGHQEQAITVIPLKRALLVCLLLIGVEDVSALQDWLVGVVEGGVVR